MDKQDESLLDNLEQYETQLAQVRQAISSAANSDDKTNLYTLENDIQELISLTKETLCSLKQKPEEQSSKSSNDPFADEYELFKAELAEIDGNSGDNNGLLNSQNADDQNISKCEHELQEDLDALKGSKCQAQYKQHWGDESYHNALIVDIETNENVADLHHIQVRVLFVNPTERDMLPCPYYLDGECKFSDDKCRYSHGALVPLSSIREYREPNFNSVKEGSQVLAKQKDNLWHRAKVKEVIHNNQCVVKFESKGCDTVEIDLHDLLPLDNDDEGKSDESSDSDSEGESVPPQEYFVQVSLMRTPPNAALGAWEKHTKGIGSRLMSKMGYVVGCGLGKYGEGRLEPVEAMAYPPGKSLDACMALREAAGGDTNMFKAEQRQKKQARQLMKQQQQQKAKEKRQVNLFSFINTKLAGPVTLSNPGPSNQTKLASSSRKGLNVERFRLGEDIRKILKDIKKHNHSLKRHEVGSVTHNTISSRLEEAQSELARLQNSDKMVAHEQDKRDGRKKLAVF